MKRNWPNIVAGLAVGLPVGWLVAQQAWLFQHFHRLDVSRSLRQPVPAGKSQQLDRGVTESYTREHIIDGGIERITYTPLQQRYQTPLLMLHGMWHGAWCWADWQAYFAAWGWQSIAFSLPGHAGSPEQRPIAACTLDYYLRFLAAEVARLPQKPVLLGHSMGGALAQWYLKHIADDLPAVVLVAPWPAHSMYANLSKAIALDPWGSLLVTLKRKATPYMRSPRRAAQALLSPQATISAEELYCNVGAESALVLSQHNPPFWQPPETVQTPLLYLAAGADAVVAERLQQRSAAHYQADYHLIDGAGHDMMFDARSHEIAMLTHRWLRYQLSAVDEKNGENQNYNNFDH